MSAITLSRELGSQGTLVAEKAARLLGFRIADKKTLDSICREYGLPDLGREYSALPRFWDWLDNERRERRQTLFTMLDRCISALARHGDVLIVGRGGFVVLAGLADVLHVRIQAPWALRRQRLEQRAGLLEVGKAEEALRENDRLQRAFVKSVYGVDWDAAPGFDLVIDTGRIDLDRAAHMVAEAARAMPAAGSHGLRTTADLEVDPVLAASVSDALNPALSYA